MGQIDSKSVVDSVATEVQEADEISLIGANLDDVRLSIDGLSLNVDLPPEMVARIYKFVNEMSTYVPQGAAIYKNPFHRFYDRYYGTSFKAYLNNLMAWEPTGASAFVCQTGSKRPGSKNTRFSWNPSKCDSATIAGIIFDGYLNIPADCLIDSTVSSIHLAADIPKARVDDQAMSYPKMRVVENRFSSGRTMRLGIKSGKTGIVVYDKRDEIKASNSKLGTFLAELKEPVPTHDLLRIEVQLKPTSLLNPALPMGLMELITLPNPFSKLRVHAVPAHLNRDERLALTVARYEGLRRALYLAEFTPAEQKSFLRKLQKAGSPIWWKPEQLWEQQYPLLIDDLLTPFKHPHSGMAIPGTENFDAALIQNAATEVTLP